MATASSTSAPDSTCRRPVHPWTAFGQTATRVNSPAHLPTCRPLPSRSSHQSGDPLEVLRQLHRHLAGGRDPNEIENPQSLSMTRDVNGEVRQDANTNQMIYDCGYSVTSPSSSTMLKASEVVTTGTPDGVSPMVNGDSMTAIIDRIGSSHVDLMEC
ncbi:fumarylacetoacetate hydrolase family protein [Natronomonas sp.]|uniref:fumarylacetoacetate hydrolase family protein n=1 Tax=Natronomonas sp. TaxID=2184060 RepID=UPI0037CB01AE